MSNLEIQDLPKPKEVVISRQDIIEFGDITRDYNPIHRNKDRAIALGFEDTPVMGSHIAAHGEQIFDEEIRKIRALGTPIELIVQKSTFSAPIYPEKKIIFQASIPNVPREQELKGDVKLSIEAIVDGKSVAEITGKAGLTYKPIPEFDYRNKVFSERYHRSGRDLELFYDNIRGKQVNRAANAFLTAEGPSALLRLLESKTGGMEGKNATMEFYPLRRIELNGERAEFQVDVYLQRKPRDTGRDWIYKFQVSIGQVVKEEQEKIIPLTFGDILCLAPTDMKLEYKTN